MDVGTELREAREQAGLSRTQVSQRTKIQLAKIEALEANAFERLPEGIYLDGLIRAYAAEVGLDGNALVARLRSDNMASPAPADQRGLPDDDFLILPPASEASDDPVDVPYSAPPEPQTIRAAEPQMFRAADHAPPARGKGRVALPLLALLAAIGLGIYLYETTRPFPQSAASDAAVTDPASETGTAAAGNTPTTGGAGAVTDTGAADTAVASDNTSAGRVTSDTVAKAGRVTPETPPAAPRSRTGTAPVNPPPGASPAPAAPAPTAESSRPRPAPAETTAATPTPSAAAAPSAPEASTPGARAPSAPGAPNAVGAPAASSAPDLSGSWTLDTHVESSSYSNFEGLQLGYRLELQQNGDRVTGHGTKTLENGRSLGAAAQTPISLQGTRQGNRLILTFTERGALRPSEGKMILDVQEDGVLRGRFSSSAARSSGTVEARRPQG